MRRVQMIHWMLIGVSPPLKALRTCNVSNIEKEGTMVVRQFEISYKLIGMPLNRYETHFFPFNLNTFICSQHIEFFKDIEGTGSF